MRRYNMETSYSIIIIVCGSHSQVDVTWPMDAGSPVAIETNVLFVLLQKKNESLNSA